MRTIFVDGAEHVFGFAILLRSVGAQESQGDVMTREENTGGPVDKLGVVIRLERFWSDVELRASKSDELNKMVVNLRFVA